MSDEPPKLTLAAETDPADFEKEQAKRELAWKTREMTANLLRVIRGAGNPAQLPQQIINLGEAILKTHETARAWAIWSAIEETLHSGIPSYWDAPEATRYETTIARGALQMVASSLVHQRAQEAAGTREIGEGIREMEAARERVHRRWAEERAEEALRRAQRVLKTAPKKRAKQKAKTAPKLRAAEPPKATVEREAERPSSTAEFMKARRRELRGE